MGILDLLKKRIGTHFVAENISAWNVPEPTVVKSIHGPVPLDIYVYDGRPIQKLDQEHITLQIAMLDCTLTSIYTGTVWDTSRSNDVVVMYNNEVIGTLRLSKVLVKREAENGVAFNIDATVEGYYDKKLGIPKLIAWTPEGNPFDWIQELHPTT